MDIDLLFTRSGEPGLISNDNLVKKAAGVVFTMSTGLLTIEFVDMDYIDLNIPVEKEFHERLDYSFFIHVGSFKGGHIAQAYQVPFMIQDDPYRTEMIQPPPKPENPLLAFERFVKACTAGQPVHREDLGNEDSMGCILGDAVPASLQFAPHLARRRNFEAAPKVAPSHGPSTPGLGGSGGSATYYRGQKKDEDKKR